MTKNPILNAAVALIYIAMVASFMFFGMNHRGPVNSVIVPIAMISLFTVSAATMGYIFLSQPLQFYLDNKKKEAVKLFLQTLATFGARTFLLLALLFSGIMV